MLQPRSEPPTTFNAIISSLIHPNGAKTATRDEVVLSQLLQLNYPVKNCSFESIHRLITYGIQNWSHPPLLSRFLDLLFLLFSKQKIIFANADVQSTIIAQCVNFLLSKLKTPGPAIIELRPLVLKTLGTVVFENGLSCPKLLVPLSSILLPIAQRTAPEADVESSRLAITCLGNLCVKTGAKSASFQQDVFEKLFQGMSVDTCDEAGFKLVSATLRSLQLLINENKLLVQACASALLTYLAKYGLRSAVPAAKEREVSSRVGDRTIVNMAIPSDSEFSDGESGLPRNRYRDSRLQLNALLCLEAVAKAQPKLVYPYWFQFLPDPVNPSAPSLISVMRNSDSPKVRHAACGALTTFLTGSKQYLSIAGDGPSTTAFTSLSQKLAEQLRQLHSGVIRAVLEETQPLLVTQELKCLAMLIRSCSYDRLSTDYRTIAFEAVWPRLSEEDFAISSAAFECISALIEAGLSLQTLHVKEELVISTTLQFCEAEEHISKRVASFDVLCSLAKVNPKVIEASWEDIQRVVQPAIIDDKEAIRAASLKFLEQYTHSSSSTETLLIASSVDFWLNFIDSYLLKTVIDTFYAVRSLGCDCLANIPPTIFEQLPPRRQSACLALAIGMVQDEDNVVRASACRALGVFVGFPAVIEDILFLHDVATTLPPLVSDTNSNVRIRASWALANLCDALAISREKVEAAGGVLDDTGITTAITLDIIRAGIIAAKDNDKCRSNGVRSLGNITRLISPQLLATEAERLCKEVTTVVVKSVESGSVKTRWNACHAIGNMLKTPAFPIGSASWTKSIYAALADAVLRCKNFKVRISAATALSSPLAIAQFGRGPTEQQENLTMTLEALLTAAQNIDRLDEAAFGEYKYREQLQEQLHTTIRHLMAIWKDVTGPPQSDLIHRCEECIKPKPVPEPPKAMVGEFPEQPVMSSS
ncbi:armadillo-type protein [Phlyctochytrium arcticum]|nr:armadillo-type protein [Phlyctochytrium arcticum]